MPWGNKDNVIHHLDMHPKTEGYAFDRSYDHALHALLANGKLAEAREQFSSICDLNGGNAEA